VHPLLLLLLLLLRVGAARLWRARLLVGGRVLVGGWGGGGAESHPQRLAFPLQLLLQMKRRVEVRIAATQLPEPPA
jgi:hypothetical protein